MDMSGAAVPAVVPAVVVVAWNAARTLGDCLSSIPDGIRVVVVDNASDDDSGAVAARVRPDATVVRTPTNLGFAGGVAEGLRHTADAPSVLLLNPDATLATGALDALDRFLADRPRAGLVSALVVDGDGRPERFAGGRALSLRSLAVHELGLGRLLASWSTYRPGPLGAPEQRDWVAATAVLVRREALTQVGGPDPSFFLYAEDRDWCRRLWEAGWEVWTTPEARVTHHRSSSVNAAGPWIDAHRVGALDRYWRLLHGRRGLIAFRALRLLGASLRAIALTALSLLPGRATLRHRAAQRRRDARLFAGLLARGPGADGREAR